MTHIPTGIVVTCQNEKSQLKNKEQALKVLYARVYERERRAHDAAISADRRSQVGTGDRSERIRTYNFPQGRVTDHRIGLTLHKIDAIMDGDLNEMMDTLATTDRGENAGDIRAEKRIAMKELWELFSSFARIGGFTFGGGYAMLPMLQKEVVEKLPMGNQRMKLLDYFAIGQCTPGVYFYQYGDPLSAISRRAYRARLRQRSGVCSRRCVL